MPFFVLYAHDKMNGLELRMSVRPKHLEWIEGQGASVRLAGPLMTGEGAPKGSMLILEADTLEAAKSLAESDPYALNGLFETVTIAPWIEVINRF